jgi:hypothetical protein
MQPLHVKVSLDAFPVGRLFFAFFDEAVVVVRHLER